MKFDKIVNSYLKESEEELVHVQSNPNYAGLYGREFGVPELDEELVLNKIMNGSPSVVALEIIQRSIDLVKKYDIYAPSNMEDLQQNTIYADNLTKPTFIHLNYGWYTKHPEHPRGFHLSFYYKIEALKAPHYTPLSPNNFPKTTKKITLDQLKDISQKELTDKAMGGHELEDLYDF
jgi:hypothetical protein